MKIWYIILIFLYSSCKSEKNTAPQEFNQIISDSIGYIRINYNTNLLNFSRIDKGSDSFELRLWSSFAMTDLRSVIILKFYHSEWSLTETTYWVNLNTGNPKGTLEILDSSVTKRKEPAMAYSMIVDSINHFQLNDLPSQQEIPGFADRTADGTTYTLEIATKNYYKIISYRNPKFYDDLSHKKFLKLLNFFQINLGAFVLD